MAMLNNQRVVGKMMRNWSTDQILGAPHFYIHKSQKSLLKDQRSAGIALDHGFQALQRWTHSLRYVTRDAVVICFKGSLQLFVTILMLDDVRWSLHESSIFQTLESYRLYPDLSIRVKQLGSSRRRFDASSCGTRQSRFTFCRVPCKLHVGGSKKEERMGKFHQIHH